MVGFSVSLFSPISIFAQPGWQQNEKVRKMLSTGERNIQNKISFIVVLTAVKFIGSMGFQAIELVFVCNKSS